ncbi:MAG: aminodeoxychorismate synthase component I [Glaciimonas sp.]|nr:aminodeoxychorismate synthase component I [Glaciimonas sp.]
MTLPPLNTCFALLDDCSAETNGAISRFAVSRLYTDHQTTLVCWQAAQLPALIAQMQGALAQGLYAVVLFSYELGAHMQGVSAAPPSAEPLAQILLFAQCQHLHAAQVDTWLQQKIQSEINLRDGADQPSGIANLSANISAADFASAMARIHTYIEAGDTYQVNYTYRLRFDVYGNPLALYQQLRQRQPVPYGALIALPDGRMVLSLSPELFVRHTQGMLTARPMKGTAAASGDAMQDQKIAQALASDSKNRAENLMIVDLLRNDLGRVAQPGSVQVPQMFEVQRYNTVLQMTSTVQAQLRDEVTLSEVIAALYPCGSITGAPKHRSMQIIAELEPEPRRLYTGAIGWFDAPTAGKTIGDFCLSVPIRTLLLEAENNGVRAGKMGVGAGIVHDSVTSEEYAECALKAKFLTGLPKDFTLFETMYATPKDGCRYLALHLQRLQNSAAYFGFPFDKNVIRRELDGILSTLAAQEVYRVRLALSFDGAVEVSSARLLPLPTPVKVLISPIATQADQVFLRHKTTIRSHYDQAWQTAEQQGAFDMLFFNKHGELTEGGRSNVFVRLDGRWFTPPLSAGVLPGVMRQVVLNDAAWHATERRLTRENLRSAEQVMLCNALRGIFVVEIA